MNQPRRVESRRPPRGYPGAALPAVGPGLAWYAVIRCGLYGRWTTGIAGSRRRKLENGLEEDDLVLPFAPNVRDAMRKAGYRHSGNQPLSCTNSGGRYWDRTSGLFRVSERPPMSLSWENVVTSKHGDAINRTWTPFDAVERRSPHPAAPILLPGPATEPGGRCRRHDPRTPPPGTQPPLASRSPAAPPGVGVTPCRMCVAGRSSCSV
jgi:hypothetical protein